nr:methyltransferase domain-containing protein [Achromobacter sp. UMC71]
MDILRSRRADSVLDAPCGRGWLGDMARPATGRDVVVDGIGLAGLPGQANGYRRLTVHDLASPLPVAAPYDAVVCSEAIHQAANPGLLVQAFQQALRPGGTLVLTAANPASVRARLQALKRGFQANPPTESRPPGSAASATPLPWGFAQLHLLLADHGFADITLHNVVEVGQGPWFDRLIAWPMRRHCQARLKHAQDEASRHFWRQAGSDPSVHGRWLVISARRPGEG